MNLNTIAGKIRLLPIRCLQLRDVLTSEYFIVYNIEQESSVSFTPKTQAHFLGGEIHLGFGVELSIVIPHNTFDEENGMIDFFEKIKGTRPDTHLFFGYSAPSWGVPIQVPYSVINATGGMLFHFEQNLTFSYEITYVEFRPRAILHLKGFIKDLTKVPFTVYEDGVVPTSGWRGFMNDYPNVH